MLLEQEGNYQVDKLHTIVLSDPEVNQTFTFLGYAVMAHAEQHNQLAAEQLGVGNTRQQSYMLLTSNLPTTSSSKPKLQELCAPMNQVML